MKLRSPGPLSIRVRLGVAIAIALLPVLLLGVAQSTISFHKEGQERRDSLIAAADRSVAAARARLDGAVVVLETVTPETAGAQCAPRLRDLMARSPGMLNMVRLDRYGQVVCAANPVVDDAHRAEASWFRRLQSGETSVMEAAPPSGFVSQPALLVATQATGPKGEFDGGLAGFIALSSLRPEMDRTAPPDTQVALVDGHG
ncbi:MAG TPA: sensor histidine kinase, partial [Caulobacteraceae bacterium]|nr:sensor histidine kinase [Caulobacteraceae bacterium]